MHRCLLDFLSFGEWALIQGRAFIRGVCLYTYASILQIIVKNKNFVILSYLQVLFIAQIQRNIDLSNHCVYSHAFDNVDINLRDKISSNCQFQRTERWALF